MTKDERIEASAREMREELRRALGPGVRVFWKAVTDSTNEDAKRAGRAGEPAPAVYGAEEQTAGRGRLSRGWSSGNGRAAEMSFLFRPRTDPGRIAGFNFAAALGISSALRGLYGLDARIKWPNDVLVNGRKICGILSESVSIGDRTEFVVTGTGINVNQTRFPPELDGTATSVAIELGEETSRPEAADACVRGVTAYARTFEEGGFPAIMDEYRRLSSVLDREILVVARDGDVTGTCVGFGESGAILVRVGDEILAFNANDVSVRGQACTKGA